MTFDTPKDGTDAPALVALPRPRKERCGDRGGRTLAGEPCSQLLRGTRTRCPFHPESVDGDPEAARAHRVAFAATGNAAKRSKRSPQQRRMGDPRFTTTDDVVRWCESTMGAIRRNEIKDYRSVDAESKLARLVLDALGQASLNSLSELEELVRGRLAGSRGAA